jgi:DNA-binding transcriptional MerR regulator
MDTVAYHRPMADAPAEELTIDELAQLTGTTVRNIRAHQSRGLLPAPEIRARTGYYGPEHVARLRMIQAMQSEGFRLDAIQRLLARPGGAGEQIFNFGRTLLSSFGDGTPEFATSEQLAQRFGAPLDQRLIRKAEKLGLVRSLGDGRWEIRNPTLMAAGEQLADLGVPLSHALAVAEKIERHTRAIADAYVRLFLADVVGGDGLAERPPEDWARLNAALERLRPLAAEAVTAGFEQAMGEAVEREVQKFLQSR